MKSKIVVFAVVVAAICAASVGHSVAQAIGQTPVGASPVGVQPVMVSVGTTAGDVLSYFVAAFGTVLTPLIVRWLLAAAKKAGIDATDQLRARLQEIVLNGMNLTAQEVAKDLAGKGQVEVKNEIAKRTVEYVQAHGAETIQKLGLDPTDGRAVEAIRARIETLAADPAVATPEVPGSANPKPA